MKQRLLPLLLALFLLLPGCQTAQTPEQPAETPALSGDTLPEDIPFRLAVYDRHSLHPALAENRANLALAPLLYEPLFALNNRFEPENILCETWSADLDARVWSFTLRQDVTFSDGTPLTGEIVAAALNTARKPNSRYASRLSGVSSVIGSGNTVTVTLTVPNAMLPTLLDIPIALDDSDRPLGTGPYVLREGDKGLSLVARSDRRADSPSLPVSSIPLRSVTKSDELILSFESGDVTLVDVDLLGTNSLGYSGSYETWDYATTSMVYLGFNTRTGLCKDARVRQALALAIDRNSIAQVDFAHHAIPSALPVHPNSSLFDRETAELLRYAPEELMTRLTELRLTGRSLTLLVNSENAARVRVGERIAEQLNWTGMEVTLEKLPFEDYTLALEQGNFDLYLGEVVLTADFDLSALLLSTAPLNYGKWTDDRIAGLLDRTLAAQGTLRPLFAKDLYAYLAQEVPIAPICFKNGCVLTRWGRLSGLQPVRGNVFYHLDRWDIT